MHQYVYLYLAAAYVLGRDTTRCTNRVLKLKFRTGRKAVALILKREHSDL